MLTPESSLAFELCGHLFVGLNPGSFHEFVWQQSPRNAPINSTIGSRSNRSMTSTPSLSDKDIATNVIESQLESMLANETISNAESIFSNPEFVGDMVLTHLQHDINLSELSSIELVRKSAVISNIITDTWRNYTQIEKKNNAVVNVPKLKQMIHSANISQNSAWPKVSGKSHLRSGSQLLDPKSIKTYNQKKVDSKSPYKLLLGKNFDTDSIVLVPLNSGIGCNECGGDKEYVSTEEYENEGEDEDIPIEHTIPKLNFPVSTEKPKLRFQTRPQQQPEKIASNNIFDSLKPFESLRNKKETTKTTTTVNSDIPQLFKISDLIKQQHPISDSKPKLNFTASKGSGLQTSLPKLFPLKQVSENKKPSVLSSLPKLIPLSSRKNPERDVIPPVPKAIPISTKSNNRIFTDLPKLIPLNPRVSSSDKPVQMKFQVMGAKTIASPSKSAELIETKSAEVMRWFIENHLEEHISDLGQKEVVFMAPSDSVLLRGKTEKEMKKILANLPEKTKIAFAKKHICAAPPKCGDNIMNKPMTTLEDSPQIVLVDADLQIHSPRDIKNKDVVYNGSISASGVKVHLWVHDNMFESKKK